VYYGKVVLFYFFFAVPCGPGHTLYLLFQKDAAAVPNREGLKALVVYAAGYEFFVPGETEGAGL